MAFRTGTQCPPGKSQGSSSPRTPSGRWGAVPPLPLPDPLPGALGRPWPVSGAVSTTLQSPWV
eukprot:9650312-Heterocapsa_arctica.AAC.1